MVEAIVTLKKEQNRGIKRPVLQVLMSDGRVTEFRSSRIVFPEGNIDDLGLVAVLCSKDLEPYRTPDGDLVVLDALPTVFSGFIPEPNASMSWKQMSKRVGVSLSQAKRMSAEGRLPKPVNVADCRATIKVRGQRQSG